MSLEYVTRFHISPNYLSTEANSFSLPKADFPDGHSCLIWEHEEMECSHQFL